MKFLDKILGKNKVKELSLEQMQEIIEQNEDEILNLNKSQVEKLQELYQEQAKALEAEIKLLQTQKNMYLFNIHMYEKGA